MRSSSVRKKQAHRDRGAKLFEEAGERMFKIMIVEDDEAIRRELSAALCGQGYETSCPAGFSALAEEVRVQSPDLILLDIGLPDTDGFKLCSEIRGFSRVPIIFVTSRNTDLDELMSISIGGDDFITKPYNLPILLARISSLLARAYPSAQAPEAYKGVLLDTAAGKACYQNRTAEFTKNEIKILSCLFQNKGKIVSRTDLIEYLWDNEMFVDDNTLSVNITRIRAKLDAIGVRDFIRTKRGLGYLI